MPPYVDGVVWSDAQEFMLVKCLWRDKRAQDLLLPGERLGGNVDDDGRSVRAICAKLAEALWPDEKLPSWREVQATLERLFVQYHTERLRPDQHRAKWWDLWSQMTAQREEVAMARRRPAGRAPQRQQRAATPVAAARNDNVKKEESIDSDDDEEEEDEDEDEEEAAEEHAAQANRLQQWQHDIARARARRELIQDEPAPVEGDERRRVKREREEDDDRQFEREDEHFRALKYQRHMQRDEADRQRAALQAGLARAQENQRQLRARAEEVQQQIAARAEQLRQQALGEAGARVAAANRKAGVAAAIAANERRREERRLEVIAQERRLAEQDDQRRDRDRDHAALAERLRKQAELQQLQAQWQQWKDENTRNQQLMAYEEQVVQQQEEQERQRRAARDQRRHLEKEARYAKRDQLLQRGEELLDAMARAME